MHLWKDIDKAIALLSIASILDVFYNSDNEL